MARWQPFTVAPHHVVRDEDICDECGAVLPQKSTGYKAQGRLRMCSMPCARNWDARHGKPEEEK